MREVLSRLISGSLDKRLRHPFPNLANKMTRLHKTDDKNKVNDPELFTDKKQPS